MHIIFVIDPNQRNKNGDYLCWREWIEDSVFAAVECKKHVREGRWVCPYIRDEHESYLIDYKVPPSLEP